MKLASKSLVSIVSVIAFAAPTFAENLQQSPLSQICEETAQNGIKALTSSEGELTAEQILNYATVSRALKALISMVDANSPTALQCITADQKHFEAFQKPSLKLSSVACIELVAVTQDMIQNLQNAREAQKIAGAEILVDVMSAVLVKGVLQNHRSGNSQSKSVCVLAHNDMSKLVTEASGIADYIRQNMPEHADRLD